MGRKSSIKRLPPEIRAEIDRLLMPGTMTYDELLAKLRGMGVTEVSRSALHRYGASFEQVAKALREKREIARAMVAELGEEADISPILIEQLHTILFRLQTEAMSKEGEEGGGISVKDLRALATTVRQLSLATRDQVKLRAEIRQQLAKEMAEGAEKVAKSEGLSAETIEKIKRQFLGLAA